MTTTEFNEKYKDYLVDGHYGLDIHIPSIISYLDKIFEGFIKIEGFKFLQIKLKFDSCRFYSNLPEIMPNFGFKITNIIETDINNLVQIENEVLKRLMKKENEQE